LTKNYYQLSAKSLQVRQKWLTKFGGLSRPNVKNREWLILLEEESRNSLMIEGYFVNKRELKEAIKTRKSAPEVVGYFDAAQQSYEAAYEQFCEHDFQVSKWLIRTLHSTMFRDVPNFKWPRGEWRKGAIKITGAKVQPPAPEKIELLLERLLFVVNKKKLDPWRRATLAHAIFEQIHPFPDGNGRVGRILANFILVAHGLPTIIIKGDTDSKKEYLDCLDEADKTTNALLAGQAKWTNFPTTDFLRLEHLFKIELANSLDQFICSAFEKSGKKLLPISELAKQTNRSLKSLQTQFSEKQFIGIKKGARFISHPDLLAEPK
jgi:Fic family protein